MTQELFLHLVSHIENFRSRSEIKKAKQGELISLFVCLFVCFFQKRCFSSCVGQGKYLQILRSDALQFRRIILWWHGPAEALDVRKKTWCSRKICVNNLRFFHITCGNTYRYRCTKRRFTASRLLYVSSDDENKEDPRRENCLFRPRFTWRNLVRFS